MKRAASSSARSSVDVAAEQRVRSFHAQVQGTDGCAITTIEGDLDDPATWARVDLALEDLEVEPTHVLSTDDDGRNLRAAIALRDAGKTGPIFVRCGYESAFTSELAEERGFVVLSMDGTLRRTMAERMGEWIGEAGGSRGPAPAPLRGGDHRAGAARRGHSDRRSERPRARHVPRLGSPRAGAPA